MFGSVGAPELILIFVVALLIFGPKKLPELGRTVGRALNEFRRATSDLKSTLEREMAEAENPVEAPARPEVSPDSSRPGGSEGTGERPEPGCARRSGSCRLARAAGARASVRGRPESV